MVERGMFPSEIDAECVDFFAFNKRSWAKVPHPYFLITGTFERKLQNVVAINSINVILIQQKFILTLHSLLFCGHVGTTLKCTPLGIPLVN